MEGSGGPTAKKAGARRGEQRLADMEFNRTEVLRRLDRAFDGAWADAERQLQRAWQGYVDSHGVTDFTIDRDEEGRNVYTLHDSAGEDVILDPGLRVFRRGDRIRIGIERAEMDDLRTAARRWGSFQMTEVVMRNSENPPRAVEIPPNPLQADEGGVRYEGHHHIRMETGVGPEFAGYFAAAMARRIGMPTPPRAAMTISRARDEDRTLRRAETRDPYQAYTNALGYGAYTEPYEQATVPRGHLPLFFYQESTRAEGREYGEDAIYIGLPPWLRPTRHMSAGSAVPRRREM